MIEIRCPDNSIARFPEGTTDAQIADALRRQFPEPRPTSLKPGEWAHRANGASVTQSASMGRFVVYDAAGKPCGFRSTLDAALDFADSMVSPPVKATQKPEPGPKPAVPAAVNDILIAHDIDDHIRQSEGRARMAQRQSINRRRGRH